MTENKVKSQTNFHQISLNDRNFLECENTGANSLGGLALSRKMCQFGPAGGRTCWSGGYFWLVDVNQCRKRRKFQFNAAGENQNSWPIYGVYEMHNRRRFVISIFIFASSLMNRSILVGENGGWMAFFPRKTVRGALSSATESHLTSRRCPPLLSYPTVLIIKNNLRYERAGIALHGEWKQWISKL